MFDADNNNPTPNTQEWGHHSHWASTNPAFHSDQKRTLYSDGAAPQRPYYWQLMNQCPQQEAIPPPPGIESWPYSGNMVPPALSSSNSPVCSRRNGDSFRQNMHNWPRPPHLFYAGAQLSEGGPPSLPPSILYPRQPERSNRILTRYPWESTPSYCAAQTLRQRSGVDTPPRFSLSTNAIYPPTSLQHNDSISTPLSTLPYYSASTYGMLSTSLRNQSNVQLGSQNPESMNYTDHGCYSLPVTTTACDHQFKSNQRSRPLNVSSTPLAKQSGPVTQNTSETVKQGLHRRALSDPGPCSLEDSNVIPSNPPPPPPPLRIDNWMRRRQRNSRLGIEPSVIRDNNMSSDQNEERKVHRMEQSKEISVIRGNESSETESEMSGVQMKPLKASAVDAQAVNKCGCSCLPSERKLLEEMLALKEANRKICREMKEIRKEIDELRMVLPSPALGKQTNGFLGWQYPGIDYSPGMISELVEEVREAAHVREEAFLAHIHSSIMSQGSSCGCGQALDGSVDELNRKKANCWWWNRSQWGKTTNSSCFPLNAKSIPTPKNKLSSEMTELENIKEILLEVQDEKKQTNVRLKMLEEELKKYKLSSEMRSNSHQENKSSISDKGDVKSSKDNHCSIDVNKTEEPVNQEIVLLRLEVQKLRMQLQNTLTAKDPIAQDQKIEQLTALLQRLMCPANGLSLSAPAPFPTQSCSPVQDLQEDLEKLEDDNETEFPGKLSANEASVEKLIQSMSFAKSDGDDERAAANTSPPNSLESNCSSSSSCSPLNFSSCHLPVTIHGPVTDL